jgi:nucleoside-diphosphate-sugar epimerase
MNSSQEIVNKDLKYIFNNLNEEFDCISGKNILLTGGAGFLGYYFIQSILYWNEKADKTDHIRLTVYDNYIRGVPPWLTKFQRTESLTLVKHDITEPLPQNVGDFQYIIHAASIASPTYYRKHPIETMDANVNGLRYLLDYCKQQKEKAQPVEGFLFLSSSEIYGNPSPENIPTPEEYYGHVSCTGSRACYDESKRYGETLCVNFARKFNLPIKIARPFNNYGPGLKITDKRVLPDFAQNILDGKDIVMFSDGSPTRTFCYVADAIVGYFKILIRGRSGEAYNIGVESPEISMAELAHQLVNISGDLFGYAGSIICKVSADRDYLRDNPKRRCPNINKAKADLHYNPKNTLEKGLRRSLIWYYHNNDAEEA